MPVILIFVFGLIVGSFLNTCIHRLPRKESLLAPPSYCPRCRHRLYPLDLLPLLGYLFCRVSAAIAGNPFPGAIPPLSS